MRNKIKHYCKYNNRILMLTPEEHKLAINLESTIFTPMYVSIKNSVLKKIKVLKQEHKYILAWRLKRLLNYYSKEAYKKYHELLYKGSKIVVYTARQNGKSITNLKNHLMHEYMYLKTKHKYFKAMRIKLIIKYFDSYF